MRVVEHMTLDPTTVPQTMRVVLRGYTKHSAVLVVRDEPHTAGPCFPCTAEELPSLIYAGWLDWQYAGIAVLLPETRREVLAQLAAAKNPPLVVHVAVGVDHGRRSRRRGPPVK